MDARRIDERRTLVRERERKRHARVDEGRGRDDAMDVDGQKVLADYHPLDTKGAGPSDATPREGEKKSEKNKKESTKIGLI